MKKHIYPKTVPQKRARNARRRRANDWMAGFAAHTAHGRGRLFR
jgi:hypothetical protein